MTAKKCPVGAKKDVKTGKCVPKSGLTATQHARVMKELGGQKPVTHLMFNRKVTKGKPLTRAFSNVQEMEIRSPSKKIMITHGNVEMDESIRTEPFENTDIELEGRQIVRVFTKDHKTKIIMPRNTKCTTKLGSHKMICKSKGSYDVEATPGAAAFRVKLSPEERIARKRERRRARRLKRRIERQKSKGTQVEGGRIVI